MALAARSADTIDTRRKPWVYKRKHIKEWWTGGCEIGSINASARFECHAVFDPSPDSRYHDMILLEPADPRTGMSDVTPMLNAIEEAKILCKHS